MPDPTAHEVAKGCRMPRQPSVRLQSRTQARQSARRKKHEYCTGVFMSTARSGPGGAIWASWQIYPGPEVALGVVFKGGSNEQTPTLQRRSRGRAAHARGGCPGA